MTVVEAAEILDLSTAHVRRLCAGGTLAAERRGRDWLIDAVSVIAYSNTTRKSGPRPRGKALK